MKIEAMMERSGLSRYTVQTRLRALQGLKKGDLPSDRNKDYSPEDYELIKNKSNFILVKGQLIFVGVKNDNM